MYLRNNLKPLFHNLPLGYISICIVISTILGMGAHNLVTRFLQQPPNNLSQILGGNFFKGVILLIHVVIALATMILYALINRHWKLKNFWVKVFAFALLLAVINENFLRRFLMEIIADKRNVIYEFLLVAVPAYISYIFVALSVVTFFSFQKIGWWKYVIAFLLAVLGYQFIENLMHSALFTLFPLDPGGHFTQGAYDFGVQIAIYLTYLVPVAGMYIAYLWIRESFPQRGRGLLYFLLLVGVHGQFLGIFQIATSQGNMLNRILYYGSFWWELLVVAYTIVFFVERKSVICSFSRENYQ